MKGTKRRRPDRGRDAWELRVDLGPDPVTRRRRQSSRLFRGTASDADTELARMVAAANDTRRGPATEAPLSDLITKWLELVGDDLSPTTLRSYESSIRLQILPALGDRPVGELTTINLDGLYRSLLAPSAARPKGLAPATVRQTHAIMRSALRQAVRWGWISYNPAVDATPPSLKRKPLQPPSAKQVAALLEAATAADPETGALLRLAVATGARRGEVLGIRESRLDLATGSVLIDRSVVEVGQEVVEKDPKTHQYRHVAIDPTTVAVMRRHLTAARSRALAGGIARALDPYVFSGSVDGSTPLRPSVITSQFVRLAKVHAPGIRLHDLRHFAATQLLAGGVPVKTVSARLGHGTAAMTLDVYGWAMPAADRGAAGVLGDLLDG